MKKHSKTQSKQSIDPGKAQQSWNLFQGQTQLGKKVNQFLNGGIYAILTTFVMLYSLFSDDVRQIFFPLSADLGFSIVTLICMIFYGIEIAVFSLFQKDYFLRYYFWLDVVSTLTMAFDLIWVTQFLTGGGKSAANISQISKASRAARLGTRTVRLIRLIRMIKLIKQMKQITKDFNKNQGQAKKKRTSQRLSSIHSKIISVKQEQKISSLHHTQKIPSKRWSVLKDLQCVGAIQPQVSQVRIVPENCLAFQKKDEIIDKQSNLESNPVEVKQLPAKVDKAIKRQGSGNKNVTIPTFEETREQAKVQAEYSQQIKIKKNQFKTKKSRFEQTCNKLPLNSIKQAPTEQQIQIPPESKVGSKVQEQVQKNIILLIIVILISIPLLDGATWFSNRTVYEKGQQSLVCYATSYPSSYKTIAKNYIQYATNKSSNTLLYFEIEIISNNFKDRFPDNYDNDEFPGTKEVILSNTRVDDTLIISGDGYLFGYSVAWDNKVNSIFNIVRTIFVCILLIITTILFSNDLDQIAVLPLEEMMDTVKKMAINPLNAIKEIELKKLCLQKITEDDEKKEKTQPIILQNTIVKIGSLLAVGFGEAGTQIICRVIEDPSIINVMIPGQKIMAIFGFCDIRNFTDATQVLEADVMVFVNQIAAICHKTVYQHLGSPNKNIGDAFLLVWKFSHQDLKITQSEEYTKLQLVRSNRVSQKADLAVIALVRMIADMARAECLQKYKANKGLQQRIPNYAGVKMGFGLHLGWAIEGPIGSQYKIDASYLGPDVHMASRLQAATKEYGAHMLITDSVYNMMSENKRHLRKIDQVNPEGDQKVVSLYTVDLIPAHLFEEFGAAPDKHLDEKQKRLMKIYLHNNRKKLQEDINVQGTTNALWNDEDIKIMQANYTEKFYSQWKIGFDSYIQGNWQGALQHLTRANSLAPKESDGPSQSLIKFIQEHNGRSPENWKGYRGFQ